MTRVPFRYAWSRWVQVGFWSFTFVLLLGAMFASFDGALWLQISQRAACSVGCVALLWLMVRLARMGAFTSDDGVEFRNVLHTERASWDEIDRFEPPPPYGTIRKSGLRAQLVDGRTLSASGIARGPLEGPGSAQAATDYLNELLSRHRGNR
jgi:hypothetical protein